MNRWIVNDVGRGEKNLRLKTVWLFCLIGSWIIFERNTVFKQSLPSYRWSSYVVLVSVARDEEKSPPIHTQSIYIAPGQIDSLSPYFFFFVNNDKQFREVLWHLPVLSWKTDRQARWIRISWCLRVLPPKWHPPRSRCQRSIMITMSKSGRRTFSCRPPMKRLSSEAMVWAWKLMVLDMVPTSHTGKKKKYAPS